MRRQVLSMKRGAHAGFTLVELIIIVAIIIVLAAFTLPYLKDRTIRTRVEEGLVLAVSAQKNVMDQIAKGNSNLAEGYTFFGDEARNTASIAIDGKTGQITVTSRYPVDKEQDGVVLYLTPGVSGERGEFVPHSEVAITDAALVQWRCSSSHTNKNQVPATCK